MTAIESFYPNDLSTGIPIGASIVVIFDGPIDEERFRNNFYIFGPDFDLRTGPDLSRYLDSYGNQQAFFLQSPGYTGNVKLNFEFIRLAADSSVETTPDYSNAASPLYRSKVIITPEQAFAASTEYRVYLIGEDTEGRGISSKTVMDVEPTSVTGTSASIMARGPYKGAIDDAIVIRIIEAGDSRNADYIWWLESNPTNIISASTSRKWRSLTNSNGIEVKFSGTDFAANDTFRIELKAPSFLAANYSITFNTGTGSISAVPEAASTSILGDLNNNPATSDFEVVLTEPANEQIKVAANTKILKVLFSNPVDPTTITDKTVRISMEPSTGYDPNVTVPTKVNKFLFVKDEKLFILLQRN